MNSEITLESNRVMYIHFFDEFLCLAHIENCSIYLAQIILLSLSCLIFSGTQIIYKLYSTPTYVKSYYAYKINRILAYWLYHDFIFF